MIGEHSQTVGAAEQRLWKTKRTKRSPSDEKKYELSEVARKKSRDFRRNWRTRAMMFLGGFCASCGNDDSRVLQIDHVAGGGCRDRTSRTRHGLTKDVFAHPTKYQVLCANCNWIKRFDNEEAPIIKEN